MSLLVFMRKRGAGIKPANSDLARTAKKRSGRNGADLISDALPRALLSVAASSDVMNWARVFGRLGHCYHNHKAVRTGLNRPAGVIP
jgi:hypothetical protein